MLVFVYGGLIFEGRIPDYGAISVGAGVRAVRKNTEEETKDLRGKLTLLLDRNSSDFEFVTNEQKKQVALLFTRELLTEKDFTKANQILADVEEVKKHFEYVRGDLPQHMSSLSGDVAASTYGGSITPPVLAWMKENKESTIKKITVLLASVIRKKDVGSDRDNFIDGLNKYFSSSKDVRNQEPVSMICDAIREISRLNLEGRFDQ